MENKKISNDINPVSLPTAFHQALWVLDRQETHDDDRMFPGAIANFLVEEEGIRVTRQAIAAALTRDTKATHRNKKGYKLMEHGRDILHSFCARQDEVVVVEPGKPFSAKNIHLGKILGTLGSEVYISDPYVDLGTLDVLFKNFEMSQRIYLLTAEIVAKPQGAFERQLGDLRHEGYNVEVGVYSQSTLHDRYIFDARVFWLSGNSLNHLGKKESFLVPLGEDIRQSIQNTFTRRWKVSKKI